MRKIIFMFAVALLVAFPAAAYADTGEAHLEIADPLDYGGTPTNLMLFSGRSAFCLQSLNKTPASGSYAWTTDTGAADSSALNQIMARGWGGPQFSQSDALWPTATLAGGALTSGDYYVLTHGFASAAWAGSIESALAGVVGAQRDWYATAIGNALQICKDAPVEATALAVAIDTPQGYQRCASWIPVEKPASPTPDQPISDTTPAPDQPASDPTATPDQPANPEQELPPPALPLPVLFAAYFPYTLFRRAAKGITARIGSIGKKMTAGGQK